MFTHSLFDVAHNYCLDCIYQNNEMINIKINTYIHSFQTHDSMFYLIFCTGQGRLEWTRRYVKGCCDAGLRQFSQRGWLQRMLIISLYAI